VLLLEVILLEVSLSASSGSNQLLTQRERFSAVSKRNVPKLACSLASDCIKSAKIVGDDVHIDDHYSNIAIAVHC
jgi:hypothetical protein